MQQLEGRQLPPAAGKLPPKPKAAEVAGSAAGEDDARSVMSALGGDVMDDLDALEALEAEALDALAGEEEEEEDSDEEQGGAGAGRMGTSPPQAGLTRRRGDVHLSAQALQALGYGMD
jgi:hypothetical protein